MALSYSFHISNGKNAITNKAKLSRTDKHNNRKYNNENFNKDINITLVGTNNIFEDVKKIYTNEFKEVLEEYNQKQTRNDRKIEDYFEHISNSNKDLAVEIIIQVGDMDFWKDKNLEERQRMNYIFEKQIEKLKNELPNFKIANAIIHYDENSPHMQIVGVPISNDFKKGLTKQVAKGKVFNKDTLEKLQNNMRIDIEAQMKELYGKNISLKSKERGRNHDLLIKDYIKVKEEQNIMLNDEKQKIEKEILKLENQRKNIFEKEKQITISLNNKLVEIVNSSNLSENDIKGTFISKKAIKANMNEIRANTKGFLDITTNYKERSEKYEAIIEKLGDKIENLQKQNLEISRWEHKSKVLIDNSFENLKNENIELKQKNEELTRENNRLNRVLNYLKKIEIVKNIEHIVNFVNKTISGTTWYWERKEEEQKLNKTLRPSEYKEKNKNLEFER